MSDLLYSQVIPSGILRHHAHEALAEQLMHMAHKTANACQVKKSR